MTVRGIEHAGAGLSVAGNDFDGDRGAYRFPPPFRISMASPKE
jgi:hypothetical protein